MQFQKAVDIILEHEGGYVNDPDDPGGETRYGISKRSYPTIDIANLSLKHAIHIYKRDYWSVMRCDVLPCKIRLVIFDSAVNQGVSFATRRLQSTVGTIVDGHIGGKTLAAVHAMDQVLLKREFLLARIMKYTGLKTFEKYGKGWIRRVLDVARH